MASRFATLLAVLAVVGFASVPRGGLATDPTQLQDFCVADNNNLAGKIYCYYTMALAVCTSSLFNTVYF
jgi:hypothetical protein